MEQPVRFDRRPSHRHDEHVSPNYEWQHGGCSCLERSEIYVDDLTRNESTGGRSMWSNISSHRRVTASALAKWMS
ncbi:hypothetical protein ACIQXA_33765 [Streptomyces massasporeus]|uniref:hypothetical protein n=1 Tax=Streptomyces massasporeus TaxID=67324 RepID=UPI00380B18C6